MHHRHVPEPHHVILTNDRLEGHEQLVTLRLFWLFSHVYCTVQSLWLFAATVQWSRKVMTWSQWHMSCRRHRVASCVVISHAHVDRGMSHDLQAHSDFLH